jgi:hypothetical protein
LVELGGLGVLSVEEGGNRGASEVCELIAMGFRDFGNQTVRAKQPQPARHGGRLFAVLIGERCGIAEQQGRQVPVTEALQGEVAASDSRQELSIFRREGNSAPGPAGRWNNACFLSSVVPAVPGCVPSVASLLGSAAPGRAGLISLNRGVVNLFPLR